MGSIQFTIPKERIHVDAIQQAYFAAVDGVPWVSSFRVMDQLLTLEKPSAESGKLFFPWECPGGVWMTLQSATLAEKPEPYSLTVELARGIVTELREFFWDLKLANISVPSEMEQKLRQATGELCQLACSPDEELQKVKLFDRLIVNCQELARGLAQFYSRHLLTVYSRDTRRVPPFLGISLSSTLPSHFLSQELPQLFNAIVVPVIWHEVEPTELQRDWRRIDEQIAWARRLGLPIVAGPIISFSPDYFPPFLEAYTGDWETLVETMREFVRAVVLRYRGIVQAWLCGGRVNTGEVLILMEEERVNLAITAIETIHELDPSTPVFLCLDQPWGEYLRRRPSKFPPLLLAQSLVRSNLPLSGIHLELGFGYYPGTLRRDLIQVIRCFDYWSILELPLLVTLHLPSSSEANEVALISGRRVQPGASRDAQARWAADLLEVLLSRPYIHGVFWGKLTDRDPGDYPHSGLYDVEGRAKPAVEALRSVRRRCL